MKDPNPTEQAASDTLETGQTVAPTSDPHDANLDTMMVDMVREISRQTDPQNIITIFRKSEHRRSDSTLSLSRRDLEAPNFRITRSTRWQENINPWKQPDLLPKFSGGLLAELIYGNELKVLSDVSVDTHDPAFEYLQDVRSLVYLPLFEQGEAINGVVRMSRQRTGFDQLNAADAFLTANLFGWATGHLLTVQRLRQAHSEIDHEMSRVAQIQRSLLPPCLPNIDSLDIAVAYETAAHAGGDYYDFFDLGDGRWGILIADVSGHGVAAAVVMAMLRTMLHAQCHQCRTPAEVLCAANQQLCDHSDRHSGSFVTAFYGIYDTRNHSLHYASAGHPPPLVVDRNAYVRELGEAQALPLAVEPDCNFVESHTQLRPGDTLLLYTDGIIEAVNESGEPYGNERLLSCVREDVPNAQHIIDCVTHKLLAFAGGCCREDDQTLLAIRLK